MSDIAEAIKEDDRVNDVIDELEKEEDVRIPLIIRYLSRDIDSAHYKIREHDRILTDMKADMNRGFGKLNDHVTEVKEELVASINDLAGKGGKIALKAWAIAGGIAGTALVTWIVTTILITH